MDQIIAACGDFRRVVISCRTQFFLREEEIPRETGIVKIAPRRAGEGRIYKFFKLYLAPFSDQQVARYVRKKFGWWHLGRRRAARAIIDAIPELSTRPMLLALVPDLVTSKRRITELYELYDFMIESWLEREKAWIDKDKLLAFSTILAVDLYARRRERGGERIPLPELSSLLHLHAAEIDQWQLTSRSLLNRDAEGNFKFAHRSIMEFLFISAFVSGDRSCLNEPWTDLMRELLLSWAACAARDDHYGRLTALLSEDFRRTGLYPIFETPRNPEQLSLARIKVGRGLRRMRDQPSRMHSLASVAFVTQHRVGDSVYLCDAAADCVYCIPLDFRTAIDVADDLEVLRMTAGDVVNQLDRVRAGEVDGRSDWREPILDEFDLLALANANRGFLSEGEYYWCADRAADGSRLCVFLGEVEDSLEGIVRVIGMREVRRGGDVNVSYTVLKAMPQRAVVNVIKSPRALLIRVSVGQAEEFRHRLGQGEALLNWKSA